MQAMIKRWSIYRKITHERLRNVLNKITENDHYATLKGGGDIA